MGFEPSVFLIVRLYTIAGVAFRGKVQKIFVIVRFVIVPGMVVVLFTMETVAPFLNAVPVMVT